MVLWEMDWKHPSAASPDAGLTELCGESLKARSREVNAVAVRPSLRKQGSRPLLSRPPLLKDFCFYLFSVFGT